ncbi:MAG: hypothetical protein JWO86_6118 [Myxococcaceae bacterium]|nr:hypothetical protein [Myxococcaceae bacterium]
MARHASDLATRCEAVLPFRWWFASVGTLLSQGHREQLFQKDSGRLWLGGLMVGEVACRLNTPDVHGAAVSA